MGAHVGISGPLRGVLFNGAESFARAEVWAYTRVHAQEQSIPVTATLLVGIDVGEVPTKYLLLQGPGGRIRFDLANYHVFHETEGRHVELLTALQ